LQAQVFEEQLDLIQAVGSYRRVLHCDPERIEARRRLAALLLELAQSPEALPHVEYMLWLEPTRPSVWVLWARCRSMAGRQREAAIILDAVLAGHPDYVDALVERGRLALQQGQAQAAEAWLGTAVRIEPTNYQAHHLRYLALNRVGKTAEATRLHTHMKAMEHDWRRVHDIVTRLMQENPHDPRLHYEVAMIAMRAEAFDAGRRWLESALREDPRFVPAHLALADFYDMIGNPGHAARHRRLAEARGAGR
jgi:tetratricopeptide (TPR) repeat protein